MAVLIRAYMTQQQKLNIMVEARYTEAKLMSNGQRCTDREQHVFGVYMLMVLAAYICIYFTIQYKRTQGSVEYTRTTTTTTTTSNNNTSRFQHNVTSSLLPTNSSLTEIRSRVLCESVCVVGMHSVVINMLVVTLSCRKSSQCTAISEISTVQSWLRDTHFLYGNYFVFLVIGFEVVLVPQLRKWHT